MKEKKLSSMMQKYLETKEKYQDTILFYRLGDFYEMFYEDAILVSRLLDLTLTGRNCGLDDKAPMCGVPHHSASGYIAKLVSMGYKVAICEQLTDEPTEGNKVIERGVLRVITPGTVTDEDMLEDGRNNYLMSIYKEGEKLGASYVDITTGDFIVVPFDNADENQISNLISRIMPSEIIANQEGKEFYDNLKILRLGTLPKCSEYFEWAYGFARADENLTKQFGNNYAVVYELKNKKELISPAGAIIEYLNETQKRVLGNINRIKLIKNKNYMAIDMNTRRNLELTESTRDRRKYGSLLYVMDKTKTKMGARHLRKMFDEPLQDGKEINYRLSGVEELAKKIVVRDKLAEQLNAIYDIERLSGKIAYGNVNPKDMLSLNSSLEKLPAVKETLSQITSPILKEANERIVDFSELVELINKAIDPNASAVIKDGGFIRKGFNADLDRYRNIRQDNKAFIEELQRKEIEATGIKNLKVGYNRITGYYIEVNKSQTEKVPIRYKRKQTIANNERYITEDLKAFENDLLGAEEKAVQLELMLYSKLKEYLLGYVKPIQETARAIAQIDAIFSLAECAVKYNFCKPTINSTIKNIKIVDGRHPVVEFFQKQNSFIANDTYLNETTDRTMIITGPNMAGKSTYMRQVAIITFLAHIGSFVPASSAEISITDRIFTRVGASDDLVFGQSTFMVEMSEVALILANATSKSLIVLDEIGRGTSTFDGLSIAWAVVEYVSQHFNAKTLFATHYHELTELEGVLDGIKNYKIAVKEIDDNVVFLRKIVRGGANKSFGIAVARLAGVPQVVLDRAKEISENLEQLNTKLDLNIFKEKKEKAVDNSKLALSILSTIKDIDMNRVSPMTAFDLLNDLVNRANEK